MTIPTFLAGLVWLFVAGALCLWTAGRLKETALRLLARALGPRTSIPLYAMLSLPGFFLHEGGHALAALFLRVPIHGVHFIPRPDNAAMGVSAAVHLARRDTLRMALIALAPLLAGTAALVLLSGVPAVAGADPRPWIRLPAWLAGLLRDGQLSWPAVYLSWAIASHMAPSTVDMRYVYRGVPALLAVLLGAGLVLALLGAHLLDALGLFLARIGDGLAVGAALNATILLPLAVVARLALGRPI